MPLAMCRKKLYKFLLSLKQPDGSFVMHKGGEVDVRYATHSNSLTVGSAIRPS